MWQVSRDAIVLHVNVTGETSAENGTTDTDIIAS